MGARISRFPNRSVIAVVKVVVIMGSNEGSRFAIVTAMGVSFDQTSHDIFRPVRFADFGDNLGFNISKPNLL
jgi:hypothetical protein